MRSLSLRILLASLGTVLVALAAFVITFRASAGRGVALTAASMDMTISSLLLVAADAASRHHPPSTVRAGS